MATRIQQNHSYSTKAAVWLFKEDLEKILDSMAQAKEVEISDGEYTFESLADLQKSRGERIRAISITSHGPHCSVDIGTGAVMPRNSVFAGDSALFLVARSVLESRQRVISKVFKVLYVLLFCLPFVAEIVVLAFLSSLTSQATALSAIKPWWGVLFLVVYLAGMVGLYEYSGTRLNLIILKNRHEAPSFWSRNKDEFWKYAVFTLLGAALTWIVGKIF